MKAVGALVVGLAALLVFCDAGPVFRGGSASTAPAAALTPEHSSQPEYAVVIDAGSTSCKVSAFHIGTYDCRRMIKDKLLSAVTSRVETAIAQVKPGLAHFANDLDGIGPYLARVIAAAKAVIPTEIQAQTPIYLQATAGMRLLTPGQQGAVLGAVRGVFRNDTACPFRLAEDDDVAVIPGKFEGIYDFLATNYLAESLPGPDRVNPTVGIVDMGGASMELAFMQTTAPAMHNSEVELAGEKWNMYSYSWLGYGMTEAMKTAAILPKADACWLRGYSGVINGRTVVGQGNGTDCQVTLESTLVRPGAPCEHEPCTINGTYQPSVATTDSRFFLESGFWYTWKFFKLGEQGTISDLEKATHEFCDLTWDQAVEQYPHEADSYLSVYCFSGSYFTQVLRSLGFSTPAEEAKVTSVEQIDGADLDWPYGFLLMEHCGRVN